MAEVHINPEIINSIIEEYKSKDNTFGVKYIYEKNNRRICEFHLGGKECKASFYIKKHTVNMIPEGKNKEEANKLIKYIAAKGLDTNVASRTVVFKFDKNMLDRMIAYFENDKVGLLEIVKTSDKIYKFIGFNKDEITLTFFETKNKAMIQGKPLQAYCIVATYLCELDEFNLDEIININNEFTGVCTASSIIRDEMKQKLGYSYEYLTEALKKSISGSISLLKSKTYCEDYKGCLAGDFVALEGYLKEILKNKFHYRLQRKNTFSMFYIEKISRTCDIDLDSNINNEEKIELKKLYSLYSDKRNVYLHSSIHSELTAVIENLKDAQSLSDQILKTINDSYCVFFKK